MKSYNSVVCLSAQSYEFYHGLTVRTLGTTYIKGTLCP
jgi:hypothetical protein